MTYLRNSEVSAVKVASAFPESGITAPEPGRVLAPGPRVGAAGTFVSPGELLVGGEDSRLEQPAVSKPASSHAPAKHDKRVPIVSISEPLPAVYRNTGTVHVIKIVDRQPER